MGIIGMFVGLLMVGLGIYLFRAGVRAKLEAEEYEFDNTTGGGVVQFPDIQASRRHKVLVSKGQQWPKSGAILVAVGILATLLGMPF